MDLKAVQAWLENIPLKTDLSDSKEFEEFQEIVGKPGFAHFLGLLIGSRQTLLVALSNTQLSSPEGVTRASVLQGQIKGIDHARETVLEMFQPAEVDNSSKEQAYD